MLIPQPQSFAWSPGSFGLNAETHIVLGTQASSATLFAARDLQAAISAVSGLRLPIVKSPSPPRERNAIQLILQGRDDSTAQRQAGAAEALGPQAYRLVISDAGAAITALDEPGLFYGVQTLIQLTRAHGRRLPGCTCDDKPALPQRGIMLDISRARVPTLATLERLAKTLAHYKINELQLYTEHTFQFRGAGASPLRSTSRTAFSTSCMPIFCPRFPCRS
jgi:N-acetyl-beta-hexosaminidase